MARYRCLLCGRDKFTHKQAHRCNGQYRKHHILWEEITEKGESMIEFKSKLDYDKWKKWKRRYGQLPDLQIPYWEPIVQQALINTIPIGLLGENSSSTLRRNGELAIKELLEIVPDGEREVYGSEGWCMSHDRIPCSRLAHRLKPGWQPPEEPKELAGWNYIATLGHGTILRRDDLECNLVVIKYARYCFNDAAAVYYDNDSCPAEYANTTDNHGVIASETLSPSNSTILWQKEEEYLGKL